MLLPIEPQPTKSQTLAKTTFPEVVLRGEPAEIGEQHGRLLRKQVLHNYDLYRNQILGGLKDRNGQTLRLSDETLEKAVEPFSTLIKQYFPNYGVEIEALAKAAGLESWKIYMLNSRTELFRNLQALVNSNECTAFYSPRSKLLCQTWDWSMKSIDGVALVKIEQQDRPTILMMTEAGIIGKIGMNSAGLGVTLNILSAPGTFGGIPIHILNRAILESTSVDAALKLIESLPTNTTSNLIVADRSGAYVDIEFHQHKKLKLDANVVEWAGIPIHSNHYLHPEVEGTDAPAENTLNRLDTGVELALLGVLDSVDEAKAALASGCTGNRFIAQQWQDMAAYASLGKLGTVCGIVMDLAKGVMHITKGNPLDSSFEAISL